MPKKILQITHKPAYPALDGGCLEMAKMSQFYQNHSEYELSVFTISTEKHPFSQPEFTAANLLPEQVTHVQATTKPTAIGGLKSILNQNSYNLSRFCTHAIRNELKALLRSQQFDLIQFESVFSAQLWQEVTQHSTAKLILNAPNIEFQLWEQYAHQAKWPKKQLFAYLAKKLKQEEIAIWGEMDGIFSITPKVSQTIAKYVRTPLALVPFFVQLNKYIPTPNENKTLSFFHIGAMDWKPNLEGVSWFVNTVWKQLQYDTPFHLAGKGMSSSIFSSPLVKEHGFVEDSHKFMNAHDVMIVPLLSGSGMRIKIIEAMALGKCIVSTSIGAEGIEFEPNHHLIIANTKEEFIAALKELQAHPEKAALIGSNARQLVQDKYSDEQFNQQILPFIDSLLTLE